METLTSFEALDRKLEECRTASQRSDDAMRGVFQGFQMAFALDHPADPFAPEYRDFQMGLYRRVAGRPYHAANEETLFDVPSCIRQPFPYTTQSTVTRRAAPGRGRLPAPHARPAARRPGGRVRARLGQHHAGARPARLPGDRGRYRAQLLRPHPRTRRPGGRADRGGPGRLLLGGDGAGAVRRGGVLRVLPPLRRPPAPAARASHGREAGRPCLLRVRADPAGLPGPVGACAWTARRCGRSATSAGWSWASTRATSGRRCTAPAGRGASGSRRTCPGSRCGRRRRGRAARSGSRPPTRSSAPSWDAGRRTPSSSGTRPAGFGLFGPYVPLGPGTHRGTVHFTPGAPIEGAFTLDACAGHGVTVLAQVPVDVAAARRTGAASLDFTVSSFHDSVEVRLACGEGATASIAAVTIEEAVTVEDVPG